MDELNKNKNINEKNNKKDLNEKEINLENSNSPLSLFLGSITSLILGTFFFILSKKIAFYFATHKPSNTSEIVQSISTSFNTLIIGLSFIVTFSFAFIGLGLFIVFIRSFLIKK